MNKCKVIIQAASFITLLLLIGGCETMDRLTETPEERHAREAFVSVNDYIGEGYQLPAGQKNDPIAKEMFEEIAEATQQFFLDNYKTEVSVHNTVGAKHGIMVFVESPNEPKFHTYAMMPVDAKEGRIFPEDIWTVEMQVEQSLFGGLLAMMMEDELNVLDEYFKELTEKYPIVGIRQEAVNKVKKTGYTTPFYFITNWISKEEILSILELYFTNQEISKKELKEHFDLMEYEAESFHFSINLYMKEPNIEPDEAIIQQIISDIKTRDGFPRGSYTIALHDNKINKYSSIGDKDNTLLIRDIVRQ